MEQRPKKLYVLLIYTTLTLATFIAFEQVRHNEFVDYDDNAYVTENVQVNDGVSLESFIWAFTTPHSGNWHPLTWLSHMLDCEFFGLNPGWHHLSNLFFHIVNTLLLFGVLKKMTGRLWCSGFVAAAFALHPLHVESVAWVSERKDVLSGFFWMLTMATYVSYAKRPSIGRFLLVFLAFCLGLMAKPMLVTLPFVLLLLDYWPLERLQWERRTIYRLVGEKVPLFVLAAISSVVTFTVQKSAGAMKAMEMESFSLPVRIANALVSYTSYIAKMIYPARLAVLYHHPGDSLPLWQPIVSFALLAGASSVVIYMARRRRYLVVGWLWYIGTLVPVIGLVQVGNQAMADRYTYLPLIGLFIIVAWGASDIFSSWHYGKIVPAILSALLFAALLVGTRMQVLHWRNDFTLFGHAVDVTENNYIMHNKFGLALCENGQIDEGVAHFKEALRIRPQYLRAQNNLGLTYCLKGEIKRAIAYWKMTLKLNPNFIDGNNNLAWVRATHKDPNVRNPNEAVQLAEHACRLTGYNRPDLLDTLAAAYAAAGRFSEAVTMAEKAFESAQSLRQNQLAEEIQHRLRLYKAGRPYVETLPEVPSN